MDFEVEFEAEVWKVERMEKGLEREGGKWEFQGERNGREGKKEKEIERAGT